MGQGLLGIGAGAAGAFGGAYDTARKNRQQSELGDIEIQNARNDAESLAALGKGLQAIPGLGGGGPPGMQGPPGMPQGGPPQPPMPQPGGAAMPRPGSSTMPSPGSQVLPPGMGQGQPPPGPMRPMGMPIPPTMAAQAPGGPPMPPMAQQGGMQAMAPGGRPQPTMPFPGQQAPSAGLTPARAPGGGPPSSSPPPGGSPQPRMSMTWQQMAQLVAQANPGIKPEVLVRAVDKGMRQFATPQNLMDWREQQIQYREQQLDSRERMILAQMGSRERIAGEQIGSREGIAEAGRESREGIAARAQEGAQNRIETQIEGRKEIVGTQEAGKGQRQERGIEAKAERQKADEAFKREMQDKTLSSREKIAHDRAQSGMALNKDDINTVAEGIADYRGKPVTGIRGTPIMARVRQLNPAYDEKLYNSANRATIQFASQEGRNIRFINVANQHLDTLLELSKSLKNGDTQKFNQLANDWGKAFGMTAPSNFDVAKRTIAAEVVKAVVGQGGGGVKERQAAAEEFSNKMSQGQIEGAVATLRSLLEGQMAGIRKQYEATTGEKDFDKFVIKRPAAGGQTAPASDGWKVEEVK